MGLELVKIKEVIVVEGHHDTARLKQFLDCDTIETNGSEISNETIELIRKAQLTRGVIILTDPDFPGKKIRNTINEKVPGCGHAYIQKEHAIGKRNVGVEYAKNDIILEALKNCHFVTSKPSFTWEEYVSSGIMYGNKRLKREFLSNKFKLGHVNNKQLYKRLIMFGISYEQLQSALDEFEGEQSL
jgi:ribonuclease M5